MMPFDDTSDTGAAVQRPARLQRADGAARVAFARRGDATVLADLVQRVPCRVLFPRVEAGDPAQAVLVTTSGGLTGGDRVALAVAAGAGTTATVTSQAAEKIYRSLGDDALVTVGLDVAADAWLEWLPQETILFDRGRLRRTSEARITGTGRLLAAETVLFGRAAGGEVLRHGRLHDGWRLVRDGRLVWADATRLDGDIAAQRQAPFGFGAAAGYATVIYAGPAGDGAMALAVARRLLPGGDAAVAVAGGGASLINDVLVVRLLDPDGARLRAAVAGIIIGLRTTLAGLPPRLPRVWSL